MAGPWEAYAKGAQSGPWDDYGKAPNDVAQQEQITQQEQPPEIGMIEGMLRSGAQGLSLGSSDEITAAARAIYDRITGASDDIGQAYDSRVGEERKKIEQFRKESPVLSTTSEIAGAIPTMLLPFMAGPRAVSLAGRVAAGAGTAGAQGAAYGFNAGEGGVGNRLKNAAATGAIAAPIGAAAPVAFAGARNLVQRLLANRAAKDVGMSRPAYDAIQRSMGADDSLAGPGAQRIRKAGPDAMLADAGPNAQSLLDTAVQRSGPGSRQAMDAIQGRAANAGRNLTQQLDDTLGTPMGIKTTARNIAQSTSAGRQSAYDLAYSQPIDYAAGAGREIEGVLSRVPNRVLREAVDTANERMTARGVKNNQIMVDIADDGTVRFSEMPNVEQLDYIKRALGNMGAESVDNLGRPTDAGRMYSGLSGDLRDAIVNSVPEYAEALRLGGDKIARDQGLRLGSRILRSNTTREDVAEGVRGMTQEARDAALQGLRTHIDDTLANVKAAMTDNNMDAREALKLVKDLSSRANREKVEMLLGDNRAANQLFSELERSVTALNLRSAVSQNSKTFARTAMDDAVKAQTEDGVINAFRGGEPINAGKRLAQKIMGRTEADKIAIQDQVYQEVAQALTGPRGDDVLRMIQRLTQAQNQIPAAATGAGRFSENLIRKNAAVTAPTYQRYK